MKNVGEYLGHRRYKKYSEVKCNATTYSQTIQKKTERPVCGERERKQMWQNVLHRYSLFIQLFCRTETFQNIKETIIQSSLIFKPEINKKIF